MLVEYRFTRAMIEVQQNGFVLTLAGSQPSQLGEQTQVFTEVKDLLKSLNENLVNPSEGN